MAHIIPQSGQIIINAILTKAGRQKLASGVDAFKIVKFAVADDQIDYSMQGLQGDIQDDPTVYPILQPIINGNLMMKHKLYTNYAINQGSQVLTEISIDGLDPDILNVITAGTGQVTYTPSTLGVATQTYTVEVNFSNGIPFSELSYSTTINGLGIGIPLTDNQSVYSISNAAEIMFTKKYIASPISFTMTLTGNSSGTTEIYSIKVIPSSGWEQQAQS